MNVLYLVLLGLAFATIECLTGGTRLLFSLPAYGILSVAGILSLLESRRSKIRPNASCLAASALFFGYIIWRSLRSPVAYLAWSDQFMVLGALVVYLLTACYFTDPRWRLWVVGVFLALASVNLAVAARQFTRGDDFMLFDFIRSEAYRGRGSGLYICPDHLAGFLEMAGPLALAAALWSRCPLWIRMLFGYGGLCCFGGILLTGSRGGAISAAAAIVVLAALALWRARSFSLGSFLRSLLAILIAGAIFAGAVSATLAASPSLRIRARLILDRKDIRLMLWPAAIKEFHLSPIVGTGSATYMYYGRMFRDPRVQRDPIRPHNDYLELLAEYGALGVAGLILFLGAHLRWGLKSFKNFVSGSSAVALSPLAAGGNAAAVNIGSIAAVAALIVHSAVDFNLHIPANSLVLAFVFGALANPGRNPPGEPRESGRLRAWDLMPRLALPALSLWILVDGLPKLPGEYSCEQARVALRGGHYLIALDDARLGLEREDHNPFLFYYLGEARQKIAGAGPDNAISRSFREASVGPYREGVRLYPQDTPLLLRLGEALTRLGRLDAAGEVFGQALYWDPNSAVVYVYYGYYLQRAGRLKEAKAAFERSLSLDSVPAARTDLDLLARMQPVLSPD